MTDTRTIPLSKLTAWKGNVRKTGPKDGIAELAASIAAHGLLQSLVVRKTEKGKYEVLAGRRRYLALRALAKKGAIPKNAPVACTVAAADLDASELSLAENVIRMPMHPADQFEAFRAIIDNGATVTDVAARFGAEESLVTKRLKLGRLSPVILDAYRAGDIDLEAAQAFAVSDDHEAQERVYGELPEWNRTGYLIRRALTENEVACSDKRIRFIGLETYVSAGGAVRRDLFDDANGGYVQDVALLDRLVDERLTKAAQDIAIEGWLWVEIMPELDYQALSRLSRRYPEACELGEADAAELAKLTEEYDALSGEEDVTDSNRLDEIQERMDALSEAAQTWSADTKAVAGAVIGLAHDGTLRVERGMVRKEDERKARTSSDQVAEGVSGPDALPATLMADLTAQKTAALAVELMRRPDVALASTVHALLLKTFLPYSDTDSCLRVTAVPAALRDFIAAPDANAALTALDERRGEIGAALPDADRLWTWCLERDRDDLLGLLAFCVATSVDAIQRKGERPDGKRLSHASRLARALGLDMRSWFVPGAENYFGRIRREAILTAISEAKGTCAPALTKLKKGELAVRAESLIAQTGWLPEALREEPEAA